MDRLVLGVDAGGTTVRAVLARQDTGHIVAEAFGEAHPEGYPDPVLPLLSQLESRTPASPDSIQAACAGIAKFTREGVANRWRTVLAQRLAHLSEAQRLIVPDYVIAFRGAIPEGGGIAVIAGTGSVLYGETEAGTPLRIGGRGWEYGDEGSGAWLTAELIRRTLRALDGVAPATPTTEAVCRTLRTTDPAELAERARQQAAAQGRGFLVPSVLALAREGDPEARNLFVGAAGWLGIYVRAAATGLGITGTAFPVATVGGLWEAGELIREPFIKVVRRYEPYAEIIAPCSAPVSGAVALARRT